MADCRTHLVVVKGRKAAEDPLKVVARVQKKSGKKVALLSPQPTPSTPPEKKEEDQKPIGEDKVEAQDSNRSPSFLFFSPFFSLQVLCRFNSLFLHFNCTATAASDRRCAESLYALRSLRSRDQEEDSKDERSLSLFH